MQIKDIPIKLEKEVENIEKVFKDREMFHKESILQMSHYSQV
ncbi:MAG: hypothetical protein N2Z80_04570 [Hydrogenothermaceae bacterium]|nr:hypothetical protein [Hydrogenothermaceae bacterium]